MPAIPRWSAPWASCPPARCRWSRTSPRPRPVAAGDPAQLAYITQTTLSVDDTAEIVAVLRRRFPAIDGPRKEDICYATTNRQAAVKAIAAAVRRSGGGRRAQFLQLAAAGRGGASAPAAREALLVQRAADIDWTWLEGVAHARHHGRRLGARGAGRGGDRRLPRALRRRRSRSVA